MHSIKPYLKYDDVDIIPIMWAKGDILYSYNMALCLFTVSLIRFF